MKTCNLLSKAPHLRDTFHDPTNSHEAVEEAGGALLRLIYIPAIRVGVWMTCDSQHFRSWRPQRKSYCHDCPPHQKQQNFIPTTPPAGTFRCGWQMSWTQSCGSSTLSPSSCKGGCSTSGCSCKKSRFEVFLALQALYGGFV